MTVIRAERRLLPVEQVAFVEPYIPTENPGIRTAKEFKARIVLLDRSSILSRETPEDVCAAHGFRLVPEDRLGANPKVRFRVEVFEPTEHFTPSRPFKSRLLWTHDGVWESKLLLAEAETVLAIVAGASPGGASQPRRRSRRVQTARRRQLPAADAS